MRICVPILFLALAPVHSESDSPKMNVAQRLADCRTELEIERDVVYHASCANHDFIVLLRGTEKTELLWTVGKPDACIGLGGTYQLASYEACMVSQAWEYWFFSLPPYSRGGGPLLHISIFQRHCRAFAMVTFTVTTARIQTKKPNKSLKFVPAFGLHRTRQSRAA